MTRLGLGPRSAPAPSWPVGTPCDTQARLGRGGTRAGGGQARCEAQERLCWPRPPPPTWGQSALRCDQDQIWGGRDSAPLPGAPPASPGRRRQARVGCPVPRSPPSLVPRSWAPGRAARGREGSPVPEAGGAWRARGCPAAVSPPPRPCPTRRLGPRGDRPWSVWGGGRDAGRPRAPGSRSWGGRKARGKGGTEPAPGGSAASTPGSGSPSYQPWGLPCARCALQGTRSVPTSAGGGPGLSARPLPPA